jgi:endonuclease III
MILSAKSNDSTAATVWESLEKTTNKPESWKNSEQCADQFKPSIKKDKLRA